MALEWLAHLLAQFQEWSTDAVGTWGYPALFLVSLIGNASYILPLPSILIVFIAGSTLNPWLVGILAGLGSAIGELTGYAIGRGAHRVVEKRGPWFNRAEKWIERRGVFVVLVVFAATPLPDDIAGTVAGLLNYSWKKFLIASFIGKTAMCTAVAWAGYYGAGWLLAYFGA